MAFEAADSEAAAGVFSTEVVGSGAGCEVEGGGGGRARFAAEDLPFLDGAGLLGGG